MAMAQMLPTRATANPMPTHQIIQTKVGAQLRWDRLEPNSPVAMISPSRKTDAAFMAKTVTGLAVRSLMTGELNRLCRQ